MTTDQTSYQPGEPVELTATETNVSDQPITILDVNDQFVVVGLGGVSLPAVNVSSNNPIVTLQPGQSQTFTATWEPSDAGGSTPSPTGTYSVLFSDNFQGTTSAEFVIESSSGKCAPTSRRLCTESASTCGRLLTESASIGWLSVLESEFIGIRAEFDDQPHNESSPRSTPHRDHAQENRTHNRQAGFRPGRRFG